MEWNMGGAGQRGVDLRNLVVNLLANAIWLLLTVISAAAALYAARSLKGHGLSATITAPAWLVMIVSLIGVAAAIFVFTTTRKASVVRGRDDATSANVDLLTSRNKLDPSSQVIRSTRFGRWPQGATYDNRERFRKELEKAILTDGADVRRIWNISSSDDVQRLRELLEKYRGRDNHSIRAYFGVEDHLLPELLIVDKCGASVSVSSTKTRQLDWVISLKRADLIYVVQDYFDGLWDRAEKILDSGEVTANGLAALTSFETTLQQS
jgi:hypothetical protein